MKKRLSVALVGALMLALSAAPALAQGPPEGPPGPPGKSEQGPQNANSLCSFSGLNDFEEGPGPLAQSYGQEVKLGLEDPSGPGRAAPGFACNGHLLPLKGGEAPEE